MDQNTELTALRDMRDIAFAIRDLEAQQHGVAKRFRRGIRMLQKELASCEQAIDENDSIMDGMKPWETRGEEVKRLIADPSLKHVPDEMSV